MFHCFPSIFLATKQGVERAFSPVSGNITVFRGRAPCGAEMWRVLVQSVSIVVLWWCIAVAEAEDVKYKDPKQPLNVRISDLLSRMTLEEKIGQMVQIDRIVATTEIMKNYSIGK